MRLSMKVKKIKYFTLVLLLLFVGIQFFGEIRSRNFVYILKGPFSFSNRSKKWPWLYSDPNSCTPVRNVAYLKAHRTASSAIQAILFRYGLSHDLHFALPRESNYFGKEQRFISEMIPKELLGNFPINIFAIHTKWDFKEIQSVMPPDTVYIASVREPIALFESLFSYGEFQEKTGLTLDEYVANTPENAERMYNFLGFNQMAWDFGLPNEDMFNETAVQNLINEADKNLDLVLVTEKLPESLVLLKHLLCWDMADVATLKINARQEKFKNPISNSTAETLKKRLVPDTLLYNHFNHKLEDLINAFGRRKMVREVEELKATTEKIQKKCKLKETGFEELLKGFNRPYSPKVTGYQGDHLDQRCQLFIKEELALIEQARRKQETQIFSMLGNKAIEFKLEREAAFVGGIPLNDENVMDAVKMLKGLTKTKSSTDKKNESSKG